MDSSIRATTAGKDHPHDIFMWEGTIANSPARCYRCEYALGHYQTLGDGFEIVAAHSPRWYALEAADGRSLEHGDTGLEP